MIDHATRGMVAPSYRFPACSMRVTVTPGKSSRNWHSRSNSSQSPASRSGICSTALTTIGTTSAVIVAVGLCDCQ
jgi:hypothetical protein